MTCALYPAVETGLPVCWWCLCLIVQAERPCQLRALALKHVASAERHARAGYENIIQLRALLEGVSVAEMLADWRTMLPEKMAAWQLDRGDMVALFGDTRDAWMAEDLDDWLSPNRIYDGVAEAMTAAIADTEAEVYIVTTKQVRAFCQRSGCGCW